MTLAELLIRIRADISQATAGMAAVNSQVIALDKRVASSTKSIRNATVKMGKAFVAVGAVSAVALAVVVGKATATFVDFEQAVTNAASVTGKSGPEYEATKKNIASLAKTLGETTVFSAQQAANALYDLSSAGYDVGTMVTSDLEPIMNLAAATQADLTFTTETVTSTLGQFGLGIEDSIKVSDIFAKTIGSSKATLEKLAMSMKSVGPVAHSLGMDIEDVNAMLGVLYNSGFKGEQAGTALKGAMSRLMNPTKEISDVLESLSLTYDQVNPATNDFADTLALLGKQGINTNQSMKLFGQEAGPAMLALMANTQGVRELEAALRDAGGAAEDMAIKQLDTLKGSLTLLKSAFEGLMISVGEMAAPAVKRFAIILRDIIPNVKTFIIEGLVKLKQLILDLAPTWDSLSSIFASSKGIMKDIFDAITDGSVDTKSLVDSVNSLTGALAKVFDWIDKHPTVTKLVLTIVGAAVAFSYLLPIVTAVIGAITTVGLAISSAAAFFAGGGTIISALGIVVAALGGPITIIIAAIALLAAAWATNLFGIRDKTKWLVDVLMPYFLMLVDHVKSEFERLKNIFEVVVAFIEEHKDKIISILSLLFPVIGALVYAFKNWDSIKGILVRVVGFILEHKDKILFILNALIHPISTIIEAFRNWDKIKEIVAKIALWLAEKMTGLAESALDWGKNLISSFIDGIKSKATDVKNAMSDIATSVTDYIGIFSPAEKGPLSDLMKWGPNLTRTFAEGIRENMHLIDNAMTTMTPFDVTGMVSPAASATPVSHIYNINAPITFKDTVVREEADIDKIADTLEIRLSEGIRRVAL